MITATVSGAHTVHLKRRAQYHRHGTAVISGLNTTRLGGATSHMIILCVTRFKWSTSTWSEQGFLHRLKEPHFFLYCLSASPYMSKDIQIFFFLGKMSYKHRCWGGKKDFLNSWQAELLEFYKFSLFTRKNEAVISNQWDDKDHWSFYILRLDTVLCLHRNKYCMGMQHVRWWLLNTNKNKARHSETTAAVQWEGKWVNNTNTQIQTTEHTRALVSAVFGQFSSVLYPQQKDHKSVCET